MSEQRILTGITTSGTPHLGNYVGAIRPGIQLTENPEVKAYYFIADYHGLIKVRDPRVLHQSTLEIAATWLALGLDTEKAIFYRQSDVPQIFELCWLLTCLTAKGLMNRSHAYKALVQENEKDNRRDPDQGISMGLFSYPILMAADILLFNACRVPVGQDQVQHIEMTRDIAARFNHHYGELFCLPEAILDDKVAVLTGTDGRKMSKSYNNTIPLFCSEDFLLKAIRKIKTNSLLPGTPKDPANCALFKIYSAFASQTQIISKRKQYADGVAWGVVKDELFEFLNARLENARARYNELIKNPNAIEAILKNGAKRAQSEAAEMISQIRSLVGIKTLS